MVDKATATGITDYINDNGIGNNPTDAAFSATNSTKLYQLNSNTAKTGLGITLKVMAGDKIDVFGKSYYFQNNPGGSYNNNLPIIDLLTAFLGAPAAAATTAVHGAVTPALINTTANTAGIASMLTQQGTQNGGAPLVPKAFINVIFFDEQFKSYDYRVSMVGGNSTVKDHYSELQNIMANKCGYVYIYCSNESPVNVYFDNLQVVHTRGPILETDEYYVGGLKMAGISYKSAGSLINKKLFLGKELQSGEFSDGSGLELYDMGARNYDQQTLHFTGIDKLSDKFPGWSPYSYSFDNPVRFSDGSGTAPDDWIKNKQTGNYEWRNEVTSASNTPIGYSYVGKQDNDIVKDLGYNTNSQTVTTRENGIIHADVQEGNPALYTADYSASHAVGININTTVSVNADVTTTFDKNMNMSKEFKGLSIDIATKVTTTSEEKLMTTAGVSFKAAGQQVNFNLGEPGASPNGNITQVGTTYLNGSITMTAAQAMQKTSVPVINISGTFWRQDGTYSIPVYPIPILSGQLNPIAPLEYSQTIVPPLKR